MPPHSVDVIVLGAGIVGVSAALALQARGRTVALVDRLPEAAGETSFGNSGIVQSEGVLPYLFPRAIGDVARAAANRDPRRFDDPTTFDPARKNARQHISFGRGIHSCPGAPLARAETRVAIERLLDRTSDIRINERVHGQANDRRYQYVPTYILRGLTELHLEFTPA